MSPSPCGVACGHCPRERRGSPRQRPALLRAWGEETAVPPGSPVRERVAPAWARLPDPFPLAHAIRMDKARQSWISPPVKLLGTRPKPPSNRFVNPMTLLQDGLFQQLPVRGVPKAHLAAVHTSPLEKAIRGPPRAFNTFCRQMRRIAMGERTQTQTGRRNTPAQPPASRLPIWTLCASPAAPASSPAGRAARRRPDARPRRTASDPGPVRAWRTRPGSKPPRP